jgi:hypothetical protein
MAKYYGQILLSTIAPGDANGDGNFDAADIDAVLAGRNNASFDRVLDADDEDGDIDQDDVRFIVYDVLGTTYGDADLNGYVDYRDARKLAMSYGNVGGWASGNFNGAPSIGLAQLAMLQANMRPDLDPPTIAGATVDDGGTYGDGLQEIRITFSEAMSPTGLVPSAFSLSHNGVGGPLDEFCRYRGSTNGYPAIRPIERRRVHLRDRFTKDKGRSRQSVGRRAARMVASCRRRHDSLGRTRRRRLEHRGKLGLGPRAQCGRPGGDFSVRRRGGHL